MMEVSGPSLVSVLVFNFTFELQSESSVNMIHVPGYFCTVAFGLYETTDI